MTKFKDIDFYFITDSELSKKNILSDVKNVIKAGCKIIQYREKKKSTKKMIEVAKQLKKICNGKAIFLINDRVDIALAVNADGVHIGQEDISYKTARMLLGKDKIIGLTVHNLDEAIKAEKLGVDYISLAPIFKTKTKKDISNPIGTEMIKKVRKKVSIPIVAIGGIDKVDVKNIIKAGADSIVSIKAVLNSDDIYDEVSDFIRILRRCKFR